MEHIFVVCTSNFGTLGRLKIELPCRRELNFYIFVYFLYKTFAKLLKMLSKDVPRATNPPKELPKRIREAPKTPTWSSKAAQDAQVGGPRALKDFNLEAQNAPRPQVGGLERFKDST